MNTKLLTIFTRSPLHVGAGSSVGAVDQPVVRERHTDFPVIPGSAIKGVLADLWLDWSDKDNPKRDGEGIGLLGSEDTKNAKAGSLLIGEGKLVAFPIRSAKGCWAWLTCPMVLNRMGIVVDEAVAKLPTNAALASGDLKLQDSVVFEEYPLVVSGTVPDAVKDAYVALSDEKLWKDNVAGHLAIVSNELFQYFAKNACEIANHNRIDDKTGVVAQGALFSQENVPSEAMFVSLLNTKDAEDFTKLGKKLVAENNLLQIGADMTTGLGWCSVALKEVK